MTTEIGVLAETAELVHKYGPDVVILAVFILIVLYLIQSIRSNNKQLLDQILAQQQLLISGSQKDKSSTEKNIVEVFFKLNNTLKQQCKSTMDMIDADRTAIYTFHNGNVGVSGFHFLKVSCISEYFAKGTGAVSRIKEHSNLPISLLDATVEKLMTEGNCVLDGIDKNCNNDLITFKLLLNDDMKKSCILYTIYDTENSPIGFISSEFSRDKFTLDQLKEKRSYLKYLSEKVGPILEVSSFYNQK